MATNRSALCSPDLVKPESWGEFVRTCCRQVCVAANFRKTLLTACVCRYTRNILFDERPLILCQAAVARRDSQNCISHQGLSAGEMERHSIWCIGSWLFGPWMYLLWEYSGHSGDRRVIWLNWAGEDTELTQFWILMFASCSPISLVTRFSIFPLKIYRMWFPLRAHLLTCFGESWYIPICWEQR